MALKFNKKQSYPEKMSRGGSHFCDTQILFDAN